MSESNVEVLSELNSSLKKIDTESIKNLSASEASQWKEVVDEVWNKVSEVRSYIGNMSSES